MTDYTPSAIRTSDAARAAMVELGAFAATLEQRIGEFVEARFLRPPPVVYRFSHPVRRALPSSRAAVKLWEAYPPACSRSGVWEIHIHPRETNPRVIIAAALAGMASAIAGPDGRFGAEYARIAARIGLAPGPDSRGGRSWRNAVIDPDSRVAVDTIADSLRAFPLGALDASVSARRIRDRNFHKAVCPTCGPTSVRFSKKAAEEGIFLCGGTRRAPHAPATMTLGEERTPEVAVGGTPEARRAGSGLRLVGQSA